MAFSALRTMLGIQRGMVDVVIFAIGCVWCVDLESDRAGSRCESGYIWSREQRATRCWVGGLCVACQERVGEDNSGSPLPLGKKW
ncbi:hypothetical protein BKA80DRAFT_273008 [Phyllosticta citrichinensis]